jgi:hypothetical protein
MKLSSAVAALLAAATGAHGQIAVVNKTLSGVSNSVEALDNVTTSFDMDAFKSRADALVATMTSGKTTVNASSSISLADSLSLPAPIVAQNSAFETFVTHLKAKLSSVEKANACEAVNSKLSAINTASLGLIEAIIAKVPQSGQNIVRQLAAATTRSLNDAQYSFSDANCKDATPTPTTSASVSTTATAPAATSATTGAAGDGKPPIGAAGILIFLLRRRKQEKVKQERLNAIELDTERDPPPPVDKDYGELSAMETERKELSADETEKKELSAVETEKKELSADDTERREMCAETTVIHEAPNNERFELE